ADSMGAPAERAPATTLPGDDNSHSLHCRCHYNPPFTKKQACIPAVSRNPRSQALPRLKSFQPVPTQRGAPRFHAVRRLADRQPSSDRGGGAEAWGPAHQSLRIKSEARMFKTCGIKRSQDIDVSSFGFWA